VLIDNRLDFNDTPIFHYFYDFYGYGGIYRSVELERWPEGIRFGRVRVDDARSLPGGSGSRANSSAPAPRLLAGFDGAEPASRDAAFVGEKFFVRSRAAESVALGRRTPRIFTPSR
jgi:beta-glucuronidase